MGKEESAVLEGLNSEQKKAVSCADGPVLIVAGAGSGKTRVLTCRIAYILETGGDPSGILALTFTKKAAGEMKERIAGMVGSRKARKLCMGTFHSVFIRFLREYAERLGYPENFTIYDTDDSVSAIKTCLKELHLEEDKNYKPKDALARISKAKNNLVTAEAYAANPTILRNDAAAKRGRMHEVYSLYAQKCRQAGVMDFDDILLNMNILFRDNPDALEAISGRFTHIMVDEYQDTNYSQYLILKKLAAGHGNICVVGDDSQSIYAFRGAKIENILNFKKDYPNCRVFRLEQNYRSTKTIVDAANSLIAHNDSRIPKTCFSDGDDGEKIRIIQAFTEQEEAMLIASSIVSRVQSDHAQYQDFAVLYRTNSQSRAIEEALRRRNLPYAIYSGHSFFDRTEVKDMMAYFKLVVNPKDDESFKRIVNRPARGIGATTIAALTAAASDRQCSLTDAVRAGNLETYGLKAAAISKVEAFLKTIDELSGKVESVDAHKLAATIAVESGLYMSLKEDTSIEGQARTANVEELMNSVKLFIEERDGEYIEDKIAEGEVTDGAEIPEDEMPLVTLAEYLENISLLSAVDSADGEEAANRISLMTVHSSKGLEYPYIYVAGMEENLFPSGGMLASESDIEEERRLFYVAVTRAEKAVALSLATTRMRHGKHESNQPSRFLYEIDSRYVANPLGERGGRMEFQGNSAAGAAGRPENSFRRPFPPAAQPHTASPRGFSAGSSGTPGRSSFRMSEPGENGNSALRRPGSFRPEPSSGSRAFPARGAQRPAGPPRDPDFVPTPVLELKAGQRVEHNRFGFGDILEITGDASGLKARIRFDDYGDKILLLNYAKIRKVD